MHNFLCDNDRVLIGELYVYEPQISKGFQLEILVKIVRNFLLLLVGSVYALYVVTPVWLNSKAVQIDEFSILIIVFFTSILVKWHFKKHPIFVA